MDIDKYDYSKCGWTDKGVSAAGNCFSIWLWVSEKEEVNLLNRINSALPSNIQVLTYAKVDLDFCAWKNTVKWVYHYHLFLKDLDTELMKEAC